MPLRILIVAMLLAVGAGPVHAEKDATELAVEFWEDYREYTEALERLEDPRLAADDRKRQAAYRDTLRATLEEKARAAEAAGAAITVADLKRRLALDALRGKRKLTDPEATELKAKAAKLASEFKAFEAALGGGGPPPTPPPGMPDRRPVVRAKDKKSGAGTSKKVADRCKLAKGYVRPDLTVMFVPKDWAKRSRSAIAAKLLAAESTLVAHLVQCQQRWTQVTSLSWDSQRKALAWQILALQDEYVWMQAMSSDEWKRWHEQVGRSLRQTPAIRKLIRQEARADRVAQIAEAKYYAAAKKNRYGGQIEKLAVAALQHDANKKRAAYWVVANQRLELERPMRKKLAEAHEARYQAQVQKIQAAHPGLTLVTFGELTSVSPRVKRLLGPAGEAILLKQSARRHYAIKKRIGVR